jgi:hypothetical protein
MAELKVPQVPYQAYPSEVPSGALPKLGVDTPAATFGANVAAAVEHMGGTLGHVGDELFTRAIDLQKDKIETEVNTQATGAISDGSMLSEKFKLNLGVQANDEALQKYNADLKDVMQKRRESLSNPYAKRLFDRETLTPFRQFTVAGATHAAHEQKASKINSALAELEAQSRLLNDHPDSKATVDGVWQAKERLLNDYTNAKGMTKAEAENYKFNYNSHLYLQQIDGLSRDRPGDAQVALKELKAKGLLNNKDFLAASGTVGTRLRHSAAQSGSDAVNTHPEGISYPPGWSRRDIEYAEGTLEPLNRVARQFGLDEPKLNIRPSIGFGPTPVNGRDLDVMVDGDLEDGAAKIRASAEKAGIPVDVQVLGNHIHMRLPKDYDPTTAPPQNPESESSRVYKAADWAEAGNPEDIYARSTAISVASAGYRRNAEQTRRDHADALSTLNNAINGAFGGILPSHPEQLFAIPEAKAAFDKLSPKDQNVILNRMHTKAVREDDQEARWELENMKEQHPEEYQYFDIGSLKGKLTPDSLIREQKAQDAFRKGEAKAMESIVKRPMRYLHDAGITPKTLTEKDDSKGWIRFTGMLRDELTIWRQNNPGKYPDDKEIEKIGRFLVYKDPETWFAKPRYKAAVPPEAEKVIRQKAKNGASMSANDVQREYVRQQYLEVTGYKEPKERE